MSLAAKRLAKVNTAAVPREWALSIANVSRRAGLISLALRLLAPIVRPQKALKVPATSRERAEYGVLLHRAGALTESIEILDSVDLAEAPEAMLYKVFCLFNQWDHESALPVLKAYLAREESPYQRLVGELNYGSALVTAGRYEEALGVIDGFIVKAADQKLMRLLGNSHELRAQVHLHAGDFSAARADLEAAAECLSGGRAFDSALVRKWRFVLEAMETRTTAPLLKMREEAARNFAWESVREADRFRLKIAFDQNEFHHLLFGTPFRMYRELVCRELGASPMQATYVFGGEDSVLDVRTGKIEGLLEAADPITKKCLSALEVMSRDFYQGTRTGGLFSQLFPGEYFDIFTSPGRIRQLLYRTRGWCSDNAVPLELVERGGFYSLQVSDGFGVRVTLAQNSSEGYAREWHQLSLALGELRSFTAHVAREKSGFSRTSLQRVLTWAIEQEIIVREGKAASSIYKLKSPVRQRVA